MAASPPGRRPAADCAPANRQPRNRVRFRCVPRSGWMWSTSTALPHPCKGPGRSDRRRSCGGPFRGEAPEPRPGLRAGHIPGSFNLPFNKLLNDDGSYHTAATIRQLFVDAGVDPEAPVTTSCGSGITACVLAAGLALAGNDDVTVYDGSWTEWGSSDEPIETGPAPA